MFANSTAQPTADKAGRPLMVPGARRPRGRASSQVATHAQQSAMDRIHALMRLHGITPGEIKAAEVVSRIRSLMRMHGITLDELAQRPVPADAPAQRQVCITRCPGCDHDPRYQMPPGVPFIGPFTAEWNELRRGGR